MNPQASLSVPLPAGRMFSSPEGEPFLWVSEEPVAVGLWSRLFAESPRSGWWPLLVEGFDRDPDLLLETSAIERSTALTDHDPAGLLAAWWGEYTGSSEPGAEEPDPHPETAPFGRTWPGTVPAASLAEGAAEATASECAELLVEHGRPQRLGLVRASSGAQALLSCGWSGPVNYDNDTAVFAAVVADWERRFGARLLGLGFDTLLLSVASAPTDIDRALRVAAEHFAFCPDLVWQGSSPHTLRGYAERLVDRPVWNFWWD
ncbi:DUF4253 domain-containing protein [Nocardiopsis ganjiahuensis]|uniref:DUF4253 domain-containing protein n=1 Tax=Nocardiopsis ganjiahuensis TaxID=239984 RepID=UPI00034A7692|nr:DUF4253 domain-containing protein [Nocardiopsis ganjiahuensis]